MRLFTLHHARAVDDAHVGLLYVSWSPISNTAQTLSPTGAIMIAGATIVLGLRLLSSRVNAGVCCDAAACGCASRDAQASPVND